MFLTVYKRWSKRTFRFQAAVISIMRGPQEFKKKSTWFSRFGSRILNSGHMCWHISGRGYGSFYSSVKSPKEIPSTSLRLFHTFNKATSSWFSQFFNSFKRRFWWSALLLGSIKVWGFFPSYCPTISPQDTESLAALSSFDVKLHLAGELLTFFLQDFDGY